MEKRELYDKFEELSQNLMSMLAEVEAIKANFSGISRKIRLSSWRTTSYVST